jgi:hypothetical protein
MVTRIINDAKGISRAVYDVRRNRAAPSSGNDPSALDGVGIYWCASQIRL